MSLLERPSAPVEPVKRESRESVRQRRVRQLSQRWWTRRAINAVIIWHFFAVAVWLLPNDCAIVQDGLHLPVRPYMTFTGLMQSWNMFAPNPDNLDVYLTSRITYADGHTQDWSFPRIAKLGYVHRYQEERYRKLIEVATHGQALLVSPSLARYVAVQHNLDPQNPPVSVDLYEHFRTIPLPGNPMPPYQIKLFYTTKISSKDLQ